MSAHGAGVRPAALAAATERSIVQTAEELLARDNAVGGVLGVTTPDTLLAVLPVGSLDPAGHVPMPADAVMPIASCSKTLVALLALAECERGQFDLDAPLTRYLPWFDPPTVGGPITVHRCLTHTAGLPLGRCFTGEAAYSATVIAREDGPFTVGPLRYSNDGYNLVGLALERVTGVPLARLLARRLLEPIGMTGSSAALTPEVRVRCAPGYVSAYDDRPLQGSHPVVPAPWVNGTTADGSVTASAADMCSFLRLLLRGGQAEAGPVVSPASFERLRAAHVRVPSTALGAFAADTTLGYGIFSGTVDGAPALWHPGRLVGYSALYIVDSAAGLGVVWLANGESSAERILRFALRELRGEAGPGVPPRPHLVHAASHQGHFSGRFVLTWSTGIDQPARELTLALAAGDGAPTLSADGARLKLTPSDFIADGYLVAAPGWDRFVLRLERDDAGMIVGLAHGGCGWRRADLPADAVQEEAARPHADLELMVGVYRSYNPFWPSVRVFVRRGELWALLDSWGTEESLEEIGDGVFRVGPHSSSSRATFDTPVDGITTRLVLDHQPYYRFDLP